MHNHAVKLRMVPLRWVYLYVAYLWPPGQRCNQIESNIPAVLQVHAGSNQCAHGGSLSDVRMRLFMIIPDRKLWWLIIFCIENTPAKKLNPEQTVEDSMRRRDRRFTLMQVRTITKSVTLSPETVSSSTQRAETVQAFFLVCVCELQPPWRLCCFCLIDAYPIVCFLRSVRFRNLCSLKLHVTPTAFIARCLCLMVWVLSAFLVDSSKTILAKMVVRL